MELATRDAALGGHSKDGGTKGYICKYQGQYSPGTLLCHTQDFQTSRHVDWSQILSSFAAMAASLYGQPARWQDAVVGPSPQESAIQHVRCRHRMQRGGVIGFVFGKIMPTWQADDLLIASASPDEALGLASQMHTFSTAVDSNHNRIAGKDQQQVQQPNSVTILVNKDTQMNPLSQMLQTDDAPNAAVVMVSQQPSGPIYFPVIAVRDIAAGEIITYKRCEPAHITVIRALMQAMHHPSAQAATPVVQGPASCRSDGTARAAPPTAVSHDLMAEVAAAACTSIQELQSMLHAAVAAYSSQQQQQTGGVSEPERRFQRVDQLLQQAVELLTASESPQQAIMAADQSQQPEPTAAAAAEADTPAGVQHPETPESEAAPLSTADQPLAAQAGKQVEQSAAGAAQQREDATHAASLQQGAATAPAAACPQGSTADEDPEAALGPERVGGSQALMLAAPAADGSTATGATAVAKEHSDSALHQDAAAAETSTAGVGVVGNSAAHQGAAETAEAVVQTDRGRGAADAGTSEATGTAPAIRAVKQAAEQTRLTAKQQQQQQPKHKKRRIATDERQQDQASDAASGEQQQQDEQQGSKDTVADTDSDPTVTTAATAAAGKCHKRFVRHGSSKAKNAAAASASPEPPAKRLCSSTSQQLQSEQQQQQQQEESGPQLCRSVRLQAKRLQQQQDREQSAAAADHAAAAAATADEPAAAAATADETAAAAAAAAAPTSTATAGTVQEAIKQLRASLSTTSKQKSQKQQQHDEESVKAAVAAAKQLRHLALQGLQHQKAIAGSAGLSLLLKLLNSSDADAQLAAAAALEVLALEEKYAFIIFRGVDRLVELLTVVKGEEDPEGEQRSAAVVQHAAAVLYSLLEATGAASIVATAGGLDQLLQVLQSVLAGLEGGSNGSGGSSTWDLGGSCSSAGHSSSSSKLSVLNPVLGCLRHMAYPGDVDTVTRRICDAGGVELFMKAVVGSTATVLHLSEQQQQQQQQQDADQHRAAGAGSSTAAVEQIKKLQLIQEHALGALWNIARVPELQPKIHAAAMVAANGIKLHGYRMCVQCLSSTSAKVQYEACGVLQWLAVGTAVCRTTIPAAGAIEPLIDILAAAEVKEPAAAAGGSSDTSSTSSSEDYQMELKGNAAGVLWHLADGMKANQVSIAGRGAIPHLVRMLSTGDGSSSSMETMQREAAGALRALAVNLPGNKDGIARAGGISQLLQLLSSSSNAHVQAMAAAALSEVVRGQPAHQAAATAAGAVKILKGLARDADEGLASSVKSALALLSRS